MKTKQVLALLSAIVLVNNMYGNTIADNMLNGLTLSDYVSAYIFAFIGMFIRWFFKTKYAVRYNRNTPNRFILSYWIKNNLMNKLVALIATILTIYIILRFPYDLGGWKFSMWFAFLVGLCFDYFVDLLKNLNTKQKNKNKKTKPNKTTL